MGGDKTCALSVTGSEWVDCDAAFFPLPSLVRFHFVDAASSARVKGNLGHSETEVQGSDNRYSWWIWFMPAGWLAGLFFFGIGCRKMVFFGWALLVVALFGSMMHSRMLDESYHTVAAGSRTCASKFHMGKITCASKNKGSLSLC